MIVKDLNFHRNLKSAEIMQHTQQEAMGKSLVADFVTQEYQQSVSSVIAMALEGHETDNFGE